ncbi:hypothetical protein BDF19DRAFT_442823 [Syncephalis fuscata]|nr:hypothetical protein BDF19DRAFT_442823 [Syncephalis fuscata]
MDNKKRQLAYAILEFLRDCEQDGTVKSADTESLEVATQCLGEIFNVDLENPDHQRELSIKPPSYLISPAKKELSETDIKEAEELKAKGNQELANNNSSKAIELYTQAIEINSENAIYYSNRAAAYSRIEKHDMAITDALQALKINPSFSRAYSRLGLAYFNISKYAEAVEAFEKGLNLDPNNQIMKDSLETSKRKLSENSSTTSTRSTNGAGTGTGTGAGAGGMPDLASLLGGAGGGAGGMPDMSTLLNNPAMMNMASQMMQNPEMMRM